MGTASITLQTDPYKNHTEKVFDASFEADHLSTREALAKMTATLKCYGCAGGFISRIEMALAELFNNIAEHAYQDAGAGQVHCKIELGNQRALVEVTDNGKPMPGGALPDGALPELDVAVADLPEGGFGWFLIRSQVDDISHQRIGAKNCTRLNFNLYR